MAKTTKARRFDMTKPMRVFVEVMGGECWVEIPPASQIRDELDELCLGGMSVGLGGASDRAKSAMAFTRAVASDTSLKLDKTVENWQAQIPAPVAIAVGQGMREAVVSPFSRDELPDGTLGDAGKNG